MTAIPERLHIQDLVARLSSGPWPARLPFIAGLVLVVLLAQQLAGITWSVIAGGDGTAAVTGTAAPRDTRDAADPERVAGRHLFGRSGNAPVRVAVIDAPDTQLNLRLRGILAASDHSGSRVLISDPEGNERVYAPGAAVPGGATVHEILTDRVLLNRRGTLETLRLPKPGDGDDAASGSRRASDLIPVDNLRESGAIDQEQLAEIVRPQAVMVDGRLHGFRIYPGRDRQRFASLGLRAGDLVTAINGIALDDPSRAEQALQALGGTGRITVTVQRGGETQNIEVDLQR